jgi:DnaJ-class molecular chaperone
MPETKAQIARQRKRLYADMLSDPNNPLRAENPLASQSKPLRLKRKTCEEIAASAVNGDPFDCPECRSNDRFGYRKPCAICGNKRRLIACGPCDGSGWEASAQKPCHHCSGVGCLGYEGA